MMRKNRLYTSVISLLIVSLMTTACSAKDAEAKTLSSTDTKAATSKAASTEPTPAEQFALVFEKTEEAVKEAIANNPRNYLEGVNYDAYAKALGQIEPEAGKIEVAEFFSYGCGACFGAEATMHALSKHLGEDVNFVRVPAPFNPYFEHLARGYYTAQALGVAEAAHNDLFINIHIERKRLQTVGELAEFYAQYGVSKEDFIKAFNSFSVNTKMNRARELVGKYQIGSVPNLVVNGKYLSTGNKAGSFDAWTQIIDQLVKQERAAL